MKKCFFLRCLLKDGVEMFAKNLFGDKRVNECGRPRGAGDGGGGLKALTEMSAKNVSLFLDGSPN